MSNRSITSTSDIRLFRLIALFRLLKLITLFSLKTDAAFRSRLVELKDHHLIKISKSNGIDYIEVLIEDHLVQKFVADIEGGDS